MFGAEEWTVETRCPHCGRGFTLPVEAAPREPDVLSAAEIAVMRHALGVDAGSTGRNRFCASPENQTVCGVWRGLVDRGFAREHGETTPSLPYRTYTVTESGVHALLQAWKPQR